VSSPKQIERYSKKWKELFDWFIRNPTSTHLVACEDEEHAKKLRLEFYKAREALLRNDELRELYGEVLDAREVTLRGRKVVFGTKDDGWIADAIANSFKETLL
jgi:hypothetical protein